MSFIATPVAEFLGGEVIGAVAGSVVVGIVSGAVIGAATAAIAGSDIGEGALKGALIGGVTTGVYKGFTMDSMETPQLETGDIGGEVSGGPGLPGDVTPAGGDRPTPETAAPAPSVVKAGMGDEAKAALYSGIAGAGKGAITAAAGLLKPSQKDLYKDKLVYEAEKRAANVPGEMPEFVTQVSNIKLPPRWKANIDGFTKPDERLEVTA